MSTREGKLRRTGYECEKSPTRHHAAKFVTAPHALESKCLYCGRHLIRSSPHSKQWAASNPFEAW